MSRIRDSLKLDKALRHTVRVITIESIYCLLSFLSEHDIVSLQISTPHIAKICHLEGKNLLV